MTESQNIAINAEGFVLTSASAGAGKTTVLVERVLRILKDEKNLVDANKLLIVTFTKAAAQEMKERIFDRINSEIMQTKNQRLINQLNLLPEAQIATVDAFCTHITREYFLELDIPYDFIQPEEHVTEEILLNAINLVINNCYESNNKEFLMLCDNFKMNFNDDDLVTTIKELCKFLFSQPSPTGWIDQQYINLENPDYFDNLFKEELNDSQKKIDKIKYMCKYATRLCIVCEDFEKRYAPLFNNLSQEAEVLLKHAKKLNWNELRSKVNDVKFINFPPKKSGQDNLELKNLWSECRKIIKELSETFLLDKQSNIDNMLKHNSMVKTILGLTKSVLIKNSDLKKIEKIMSYSDISLAVLRLLTDKTLNVMDSLTSRYSAILIDEYQDINDLQNQLFYELSQKFTNAFIVGDAKQSIYGFRDSNPKNFIDYYKKLPNYSENSIKSRITLNYNFRSKNNICEFINNIFANIMTDQVGDISYNNNEELIAAKNFEADSYPDVEIKLIETSVDKTETSEENLDNDSKSEELEAIEIAETIVETMDRVPFLKGENGLRTAEFNDIAILFRVKKNFDILIKILKEYNIPVSAKNNIKFLDCIEINTIISLLKIIINPKNEIALAAVLYSPLYSFSVDELADLKLSSPNTELFYAIKSSTNKKCVNLIADLDIYTSLSYKYTCFEFINYILEHTKLIYTVLSMDDGTRRKNNLLLLLEYAKKFSTLGENKLYFFVKYLERIEKLENGVKSFNDISNTGGCVKIMTIHNSKGLQFPICILGNLNKKFNLTDLNKTIVKEKEMGVGLKLIDENNIYQNTMAQKLIKRKLKSKLLSEEIRLLYVALTRSEEKIILTGVCSNFSSLIDKLLKKLILNNTKNTVDSEAVSNCNNYLEWVFLALLNYYKIDLLNAELTKEIINKQNYININIINKDELNYHNNCEAPCEKQAAIDENLYNEIISNLNNKYDFDYLNNIYNKISASQLKSEDIDIESFNKKSPTFSKEKLSAAEIGTSHHEFLQYADFVNAKKDLSAEKQRLLQNKFMRISQINCLNDETLNNFFNSDLYKRALNADKIIREKRFMIESTAEELKINSDTRAAKEPLIIQGVIDLVFFEKNDAVIVDYKTDRITDEAKFIEYYTNQLYIYKLAISKIYNVNVKLCYIYSLYLHKEIPVNPRELLL